MNATDVKTYKKNGQERVKFRFTNQGKSVWLDFLVVKKAKVKASEGESEGRVFIEARVCSGTVRSPVLFSLNERSKMKYPVLLGREVLRGRLAMRRIQEALMPLCISAHWTDQVSASCAKARS